MCMCGWVRKCTCCPFLTGEVVVLLTVCVSEGDQLPEQQGVLEHPLHRFNQVGLQGGRVLLGGVPRIQEFLEGLICLSWKTKTNTSWIKMNLSAVCHLCVSWCTLAVSCIHRERDVWLSIVIWHSPVQGSAGSWCNKMPPAGGTVGFFSTYHDHCSI